MADTKHRLSSPASSFCQGDKCGIGSPSSFSRVGTRNPALSGGSRHALHEAYFYASCGTMRGAGSRSRLEDQDREDTRQDDTDVLWTGFAGISKPTTKRDRYVPLKGSSK